MNSCKPYTPVTFASLDEANLILSLEHFNRFLLQTSYKKVTVTKKNGERTKKIKADFLYDFQSTGKTIN